VKYAWIDAQRGFALAEMCAVLDVSVSGYRAWKRGGKLDRKRLSDGQMLTLIQAIHAEHKGAYGSPPHGARIARARFRGEQGTGGAADALTMAWFRRKPAAGLLHHSDRGSQYASQAFQSKLGEYDMLCSMSRKGNCWDNAPTESWFNSFKNERVHGERFATRAEMTAMAFEYIEVFYNRKRLHSTLGYKPPIRFLQDWLAAQ